MRRLAIGRGLVFEFLEPYRTNVMVVLTERHILLCDTFCGPDPVRQLLTLIEEVGVHGRRVVVFNSHHHYDHVWGNCAFVRPAAVCHALCLEYMRATWAQDIRTYAHHMMGHVEFRAPAVVFGDSLHLRRLDVWLWHTPGHTLDSSSCYDPVGRVLFVGDNVESPIPYLTALNTQEYLHTLQTYLDLEWDAMVASHDVPMEDDQLLQRNMEYLTRFAHWDGSLFSGAEETIARHIVNLAEVAAEVVRLRPEGAHEHYATALDAIAERPSLRPDGIHMARLRNVVDALA